MNEPAGTVTVEFFGVVRSKAGVAAVRTVAGTVREILREVAVRFPSTAALLSAPGGGPVPVLVSVAGERFVSDHGEFIPAGTRLLVLGADAGG